MQIPIWSKFGPHLQYFKVFHFILDQQSTSHFKDVTKILKGIRYLWYGFKPLDSDYECALEARKGFANLYYNLGPYYLNKPLSQTQ